MTASLQATHFETDSTDREALLLMLSYVEAECRRLGALDAARHAALAASALPSSLLVAPSPQPSKRKASRLRLH